jgi:PGF-pre-PGF domain-containing protein
VYPVTIDPVVASATTAAATFTGAAADDYFSISVALSSDGSRALVGAVYNDAAGLNAGAAYLFAEPSGGWAGTTPATGATATFTGAAADDEFGYSVALSSDGSRALVGAYGNSAADSAAGAAYLFAEPSGGWAGTIPATGANATFTGAAANDQFGYSVALSSNGSRTLVGAVFNDAGGSNAGAAYLFAEPSGGWAGTTPATGANATFTGAAADDNFGYSVALSSDGSRTLVGAYFNDAGGSNAGAAYLFAEPSGGWAGTTPATGATATFTGAAANDYFGKSVALSSNGSRALVGAVYNDAAGMDTGAAYLFAEPSGGWAGTTPATGATATFTGAAANERFGNSVAFSTDGSRALVGAYYNSAAGSAAGAAYLFAEPSGGWAGTIPASGANATFTGAAANDQFGYSVALSSNGSRALVGARYNDAGGSNAGAAYLFRPPYATLTAGGTTNGFAGRTVNGLTLKPSGTLTNIDLYLGTDALTLVGAALRTGIASLPVSTTTTVDGVDLAGKDPGTYYLIACEHGTTRVLAATIFPVYTVLPPPVVSGFTGSPTSGNAPLTVAFTDLSNNTPTNWDWNFGSWSAADGGVSTLQAPSHIYTSAGTYTVSLNARNAYGGDTFTRTGYITVTAAPVTTSPTAVPGGGSTAGSSGINGGDDPYTGPAPAKKENIVMSVDSSYLAEHGVVPADIRIMSYSDSGWTSLDTRFTGSSGNRFYFASDYDRYSPILIGNLKDDAGGFQGVGGAATMAPTIPGTMAITRQPPTAETRTVSREETAVPVVQQPAAEPPAPAPASVPAGSSNFPVMALVLIGAGCIVLTGAGWYVRRWWIHRQNPVLFREYD